MLKEKKWRARARKPRSYRETCLECISCRGNCCAYCCFSSSFSSFLFVCLFNGKMKLAEVAVRTEPLEAKLGSLVEESHFLGKVDNAQKHNHSERMVATRKAKTKKRRGKYNPIRATVVKLKQKSSKKMMK